MKKEEVVKEVKETAEMREHYLKKEYYNNQTTSNVIFDLEKKDGGIEKVFKVENQDDRNKFEKHFKFQEIQGILDDMVHDKLEPMRERIRKIDEA